MQIEIVAASSNPLQEEVLHSVAARSILFNSRTFHRWYRHKVWWWLCRSTPAWCRCRRPYLLLLIHLGVCFLVSHTCGFGWNLSLPQGSFWVCPSGSFSDALSKMLCVSVIHLTSSWDPANLRTFHRQSPSSISSRLTCCNRVLLNVALSPIVLWHQFRSFELKLCTVLRWLYESVFGLCWLTTTFSYLFSIF